MVDTSKIELLITRDATERELLAELKRDLSILGASFATPKREYIVFSEFPVGHGIVDFVIFTDRSRMSIILIEIKGAHFSFLNRNGSIAADINLASQQMFERLCYIQDNYEAFRRESHIIRRAVEGGAMKHRSLLGPNGFLHVDPEKDVTFRGVVVGGRTRDDYDESHVRHRLEKNNLNVRFESWDSWVRKCHYAY